MSKFTAAELEEVATAYAGYCKAAVVNHITPTFEHWWTERNKPAKKIIDMAHFIKSGIDMEFSSNGSWFIGTLYKVKDSGVFNDGSPATWKYCRPRMNHKMYHDGGACPLPEGFKVKLLTICGGRLQHTTGLSSVTGAGNVWKDKDYYPVIGYEILGLADGWAYPWEVSDE